MQNGTDEFLFESQRRWSARRHQFVVRGSCRGSGQQLTKLCPVECGTSFLGWVGWCRWSTRSRKGAVVKEIFKVGGGLVMECFVSENMVYWIWWKTGSQCLGYRGDAVTVQWACVWGGGQLKMLEFTEDIGGCAEELTVAAVPMWWKQEWGFFAERKEIWGQRPAAVFLDGAKWKADCVSNLLRTACCLRWLQGQGRRGTRLVVDGGCGGGGLVADG